MHEAMDKSRVKGFLRAEGTRMVNGDGEEVILTGVGLGNWLLCEGYMWRSHFDVFNKPRNIEAGIRELAGSGYAGGFWKKFRENYITREDIRAIAEAGFNSVRIPINWRGVMENEPGITWKEDGFRLIENCVNWCEEFGIYAFLDLHGAPGGQTGDNIDDAVDFYPRLFMDADSRVKALALWQELARRYKDRWIVGGYDLLNEPIRTVRPGMPDVDFLLPELHRFYIDCVAAVREIDGVHMLSIEGHHWATDTSVFTHRFDDNMCIHFHRYWCMPGMEAYREFLELSRRLDCPLWLGETGENSSEWYAAMYGLAYSLHIGVNFWPWKKMACKNSPYSVKMPAGWEKLLGFFNGGVRPSYEETWAMLDEYLENMKLENCDYNPDVIPSILRRPGCRLPGVAFDMVPGKGVSFSGLRRKAPLFKYQGFSGMGIVPREPLPEKESPGPRGNGWEALTLEMTAGEWADYTFYGLKNTSLVLEVSAVEGAEVTVLQDGKALASLTLRNGETAPVALEDSARALLTLRCGKGSFRLDALRI
ncbi:MAG: glycoside hydrolase family 5 protein [Christensenellales bacterium]|jgi:endoglucanase